MFKKNISHRKKFLLTSFFKFSYNDLNKLLSVAFKRVNGENTPLPVLEKHKYEDPELRAIMTITPEQVIRANEMMKQGVKPKTSYAQRFNTDDINKMLQTAFDKTKEK